MIDLNLQLFRRQRADTIRPGQLIVDEHGIDLLVDEVALRSDQVVLLGRRPAATSTRRLAIRCALDEDIVVLPSTYNEPIEALERLTGVSVHGMNERNVGKGWVLGFTLPHAAGGIVPPALTLVDEEEQAREDFPHHYEVDG